MIEFALDRFPVRHTLTTGVQCLLRPLQAEDEAVFQSFQQAVPEKERFLIKHRITGDHLLHEWCQNLDYESNLPLLALADGKVVGYATLHQRPGGWKRHIGMVSALIHPDFRGVGVLRQLLDELINVAKHAGLTRLEAEFNGERKNTIASFGKCGFVELVRLPEYLQDMQAQPHDYVLLGMNLMTDLEYTGAGD
jgi:L-amino acid N-acyltransferase YncA